MYSPIAQFRGLIDRVGVPAATFAGFWTDQPVTSVVSLHTCSGMKPWGVENAFTAVR